MHLLHKKRLQSIVYCTKDKQNQTDHCVTLTQLTLEQLSCFCHECICRGKKVQRGLDVFMHWSFGQLSLIWDLQVTLCPHTRPLTLWGLWSETEGLLLVIRQPVTGHAQSIMVLLHYVSKYTQAHPPFPLCHPCNPYTLKGQGSQKTQKQIKTCNMMFHLKPNKACFFELNNKGEYNFVL